MRNLKYIISITILATTLVSCEKEIDVPLPPTESEIVVEAYINQLDPLFNYVVLTRSVDYFNPQLNAIAVSNAQVFITEGLVNGPDTVWDDANKKQLVEVAQDTIPGIYFNINLVGRIGYVYRLEINADGKYIHGVTSIPALVPLDSLTSSFRVNPVNDKDTGYFMTIHFDEPAETGNNYRYLFKVGGDTLSFGWGSINEEDGAFNDEIVNGVYRSFTFGDRFKFNDTVSFYLTSIDRPAFNFWDSYSQARSNGGPFATPVQLKSNINGAIGSFTGKAVSRKRLIFKP
jgi:hypothetical protein